MKFDIFFSISQTPVDGTMPTETQMFRNFFEQVIAADRLGYGVAWIAESHLSSDVQKSHVDPVIPHWKGEVGLNVDFFQLAHRVFAMTRRIELGSAVMNIVCNGGPVAAAERTAAFCALHGVDPGEKRRIHIGFSGGRFEFMNRAYGIVPRCPVEEAAWPALRGRVFAEAVHIFLRLLRGDTLASADVPMSVLTRANFRSDEDWSRVQRAAMDLHGWKDPPAEVHIDRRWSFDVLKVIPQDWRRELLQLVAGSHDPSLQVAANEILPVQIFNLSITRPEIIEDTHRRMEGAYHPDGGSWRRDYMPRTVFVFINETPALSPDERCEAAREEARSALAAYWTALEGTLDPSKVENAATNALIGDAEMIAQQIRERFHPEDRVMLWFDFFNHDSKRVVANMEAFMNKVTPLLEAGW